MMRVCVTILDKKEFRESKTKPWVNTYEILVKVKTLIKETTKTVLTDKHSIKAELMEIYS